MLKRLRRIVRRGLAHILSCCDNWTRIASPLPPGAFGGRETTPAGALTASLHTVTSLDELTQRLATFQKVSGRETAFGGRTTAAEAALGIEATGRGHCVAHACWAFAQLVRLGATPELVVGRWPGAGAPDSEFHVWVQFERDGCTILLETTSVVPDGMLRPLTEARGDYVPLYAASASGATYVYASLLRERMAG